MNKPTILIVTRYFYPGFKAGGPIQSLCNLLPFLTPHFNIKIIAGAFDLMEQEPYQNVPLNIWIIQRVGNIEVPVYYTDEKFTWTSYSALVQSVQPAFVYLNEIFGWNYFVLPVLYSLKNKTRLVICPRGMLQSGALKVKSTKKKLFLACIKYFIKPSLVTWHATTTDEAMDIQNWLGRSATIKMASNVPIQPKLDIPIHQPSFQPLRLVYLSVIAPKKNVLETIQLIQQANIPIQLDIYGAVKEKNYWKNCETAIAASYPNAIQYKGELPHHLVQSTLQYYDAFILLTKGENFGHAIYESLSVGLPVITSSYTPWSKKIKDYCGWVVDINHPAQAVKIFNQIASTTPQVWKSFQENALALAKQYFEQTPFEAEYLNLFQS